MGLPSLSPDLRAPTGRLRDSHLLRLGLLTVGIIAALLGVNLLLNGTAVMVEARLSLLVVLALAWVIPRSLPRTLIADDDQIRWKQPFQPPRTIARRDVSAVVYLHSAASGSPRFYFVGRDDKALLWIDRFTQEQMAWFAAYVGITMRSVTVAPMKDAAADQAANADVLTGARRGWAAAMGVCLLGGIGLTAALDAIALSYRSVMADYDRAPLCAQAASNPRACRFDTRAQVTGFTARGAPELRFPSPVPTLNHQTTYEGLLTAPNPAFSTGDTVQVEVFDGYLMAINGARTTTYGTLTGNSSLWLLGATAGLFVLLPGMAVVLALKAPASWLRPRSASA